MPLLSMGTLHGLGKETYPSHSLLQVGPQCIGCKPELHVFPDKSDLPSRVRQNSRAHDVISNLDEWPAPNVIERLPSNQEGGAGAHCTIDTIVNRFLKGVEDVEVCHLAKWVDVAHIVIALDRSAWGTT